MGIIATVEVQAALWVCRLGDGGNTIWVFFTTPGQCSHFCTVGFILTWIECPFLSVALLRRLKTGFQREEAVGREGEAEREHVEERGRTAEQEGKAGSNAATGREGAT